MRPASRYTKATVTKSSCFGPAIALASAVTLYGGVWGPLARVFF